MGLPLASNISDLPSTKMAAPFSAAPRTFSVNWLFNGYAPIFADLDQEGYCVNVELREGKDHSQIGTPHSCPKASVMPAALHLYSYCSGWIAALTVMRTYKYV